MPDYRVFQPIVTGIALLYLYLKSRQLSRLGQSTMPEVVQIIMWGVALLLSFYLPERIGPMPVFILSLIIIVIVSTRLNLWRLKQQRAAESAEKHRQAAASATDATRIEPTIDAKGREPNDDDLLE